MKQDEEYMTKTFGQSKISRQLFENMPYPICVKNLTDEQMEELAKNVERDVIREYPAVAEKMFSIWIAGAYDDEEMDFLENESLPIEDLWWDLLQWYAINKYDAKYYCDIELDEMLTKKNMESSVENLFDSNTPSQEQIESAIEYIDMKSEEYKEAADMMEETKRRAEVVKLAEKLWLRNIADLDDAFEDAETFIKLKSKYLKEGKLC